MSQPSVLAAGALLGGGSGAAIRERYRRVVHRIVRSLYGLEVPLIAAVNGPAMGLGCDIAGLADIRIASDRASFGVPFLKLGIIPGGGGAWHSSPWKAAGFSSSAHPLARRSACFAALARRTTSSASCSRVRTRPSRASPIAAVIRSTSAAVTPK